MTTKMEQKEPTKKALRFIEYYDMQGIFDSLYEKSVKKYIPHKLMDLVLKEENVLLAYRNIKRNKGSKTAGVDKVTIEKIEKMNRDEFTKAIKSRINNYRPNSIRGVEIPKPDCKMRPLGIPTIEDRIIQQSLKQILEPICEAKFYEHPMDLDQTEAHNMQSQDLNGSHIVDITML